MFYNYTIKCKTNRISLYNLTLYSLPIVTALNNYLYNDVITMFPLYLLRLPIRLRLLCLIIMKFTKKISHGLPFTGQYVDNRITSRVGHGEKVYQQVHVLNPWLFHDFLVMVSVDKVDMVW